MKYPVMFFILFTVCPAFAGALQEAINNAPVGSTIILGEGLYEGSIFISKSLVLKGKNDGAVIKGDGKGSVITVTAANVTVQGLTIMGSGESHETSDACVTVKDVNNVAVLGNVITDCLFGVNFENTNISRIENNKIQSKNFSLGLKGDGIRLWYSHSNIIRSNEMTNVRDMVFWYSSANQITNNRITNSRYSVHCMYADRNFITDNYFEGNSVGVFLMYSSGSKVSGNKIVNSSDPFGIGIGFKEVSDCEVKNNVLMYNARGLYIDQSPYQPGTVNKFIGNKILYNAVGAQLHGIIYGSIFEENVFNGNIESLANDTPSSNLSVNRWYGNYWDEYEGFDTNGDGRGDTPFQYNVYADRMIMRMPAVKFFYGSPVISLLNFLVRLLPFSDPEILAEDIMPRMEKVTIDGI